jgi:hypothetical protein
MIPYDELVAALASWRQRQGLPAGPADYLGEPSQARYDDYAPATASGGYGEDVVELSDEMMDSVVEEPSSPYSVEAVETVDEGSAYESDTQDQDYESALPVEPPKPEPEPQPEPTGRRKRKR